MSPLIVAYPFPSRLKRISFALRTSLYRLKYDSSVLYLYYALS